MYNVIIGVGNTGTNIVKAAALSTKLNNVKLYAIDSIAANVDPKLQDQITFIPIISDEKNGSGRSRERGAAMFEYHDSLGNFDEMYRIAEEAKSPVIVVTSSAGGTGSGASVPLCKRLMDKGIQVIPVIVIPNLNDPAAYHLNTNDLLIELQNAGIQTYNVFRNSRGDADYTSINNDIVSMLEIIFGHRYDHTELDSIDDSDLDVILSLPGRFIAIAVEANDIQSLKKEITRQIRTGYQPTWTDDDSMNHTLITAYSLTSLFAQQDFKEVFEEVNARVPNVYDEYRNICQKDNDGKCAATLIVSGLPRMEIKKIDNEFMSSNGIGDGILKSHRPEFLQKKKAIINKGTAKDGTEAMAKFSWK